jgi:hypothetical protein
VIRTVRRAYEEHARLLLVNALPDFLITCAPMPATPTCCAGWDCRSDRWPQGIDAGQQANLRNRERRAA